MTRIIPHTNQVELLNVFGNDQIIAERAWTSTTIELTPAKIERIPSFLSDLALDEHESPFEGSLLRFRLRVDTATHIHILKHRIGVSVNGESARYKELQEDKFYAPTDWPQGMRDDFIQTVLPLYEKYHRYIEDLVQLGLTRKRAKESARLVLPYANQLYLDVCFNWRSFFHFFYLRAHGDAQLEIQQVAKECLRLVSGYPGNPFEHTISALFRDARLAKRRKLIQQIADAKLPT